MSAAATSATIPIEEFERKLQETVEARALILRFEDDACGADEDAITFPVVCTTCLGSTMLRTLLLTKLSNLHDALERIMAKGRQLSGASLIHYAVLEFTDDTLQNLDVLDVLDCCYPGSAVRAGAKRAVQLLAASYRHSKVRSPKDGVSFTQRFRQAAYALKLAVNLSVNPSKAPDVVYKVIGNARPSGNLDELSSNETSVLFKISLTGRPSNEILKDFQQLSKTIPPQFKVTAERAYESNSVLLICRASWETFARGPCLVQDALPQKSTRSFGDDIQNRQAD
ncbi:hypothetical protein V1525DRAFT_447907 [Lipomyces kononenkoae]|uniref:Uncharacterized protein n=1 Tax=Lipomyces kononenkoae TaxID=34357 RepID=A0ACC3T9V1_LIPKO